MNLHQLASGAIGTVNPFKQVTIKRNMGYSTREDGTREPHYVMLSGPAQIQELTAEELQLFEGLNLQGVSKGIWLNGRWSGTVRADTLGGDIFMFEGADWLVVAVPERWPDWTHVVVRMQSPRPTPPSGEPIIIDEGVIGYNSTGDPENAVD
jgi:hypothetical protein